jgi:superfamily II DNA/RNA helicase
MNSRGNAPGGHSPAIADWLQPLASPKLSGAFPRKCPAIAGECPLCLSTALYSLYSALQYTCLSLPHSLMFTYLPAYRVLICVEHQHAVYGLDEHLKRHHGLLTARRKELLAAYAGLAIDAPTQLSLPAPNSAAIAELGQAQDAFLCCQKQAQGAEEVQPQHSTCSYITINQQEMRKHTNQHHSVKLTRWSSPATASYKEHAAQLWQPVKVQTFFRERRYIRYFVVQAEDEEAQEEQQQAEQQQGGQQQAKQQQESERQGDYKQRLALLSSSLEALKHKDNEAINCIAEETSAKDRTGWFKRTQWDEHLQAYPDWKLLAYAIRPPGDDELALKQVMLAVEEVVEQAVCGLSTLSTDTLRWLKSAKPNEADARPLGRMQNKDSQQRAARLWARLLCYCVRLVAAEEEEDKGEEQQPQKKKKKPSLRALVGIARLFPWHSRQKQAARRLWKIVAHKGGRQESTDTAEEARKYVLRLTQELVCQEVCHQPFKSGLIHFLAVLGVNPDTLRLRTAPEYSSLLGSLVYCVRVLTIEAFLPSEQRGKQGAVETRSLLQQRSRYLIDGSHSPMSVMLSLLSYAKFVSLRTPGSIAGSMWWSLDRQTFFIKGRPVELARFRTMAQSIVAEAGQVLWKQLLWMEKEEKNSRLHVDLAAIQDDVTIVQRGVSFLSPGRLQEAERWMLKRLASIPAAQRLYERRGGAIQRGSETESDSGRPVQWRPQEVRRHLRHTQHFLELLSLAVHVAGGQPARGPELLSVRWRNGVLQDRNLYVIDGQVAVVTRYHKTQSQWDKPKVVVRFLPDAVGQLVVAYLLYIRPLQVLLQSALDKPMSTSVIDYLWADERGSWETDRLTNTMTLESAKWLGTRLTVQEYRHAAVGIGREVVGERFAIGYRTEMTGGAAEEGKGSSDEDREDPIELQNGRTTSTGVVAYAVRADLVQGLSTRSIDVFRTLSHAWHAFLGFDPAERKLVPLLKRKREQSNSQAAQAQHDSDKEKRPTLKRAQVLREGQAALVLSAYEDNGREEGERRGQSNVDQEETEKRGIEDAVRQVLGILPGSAVTYRSPKQEEALYAVVQGVSPLIVVLPTGGGKTLLPVAAAVRDGATQRESGRPSVTILIMPFRALVEDMLVRLHKAGIKAVEWQAGAEGDYQNRRTPASIVLVSADYVGNCGGQFLSYAALLARQGVLRRVVVDECHIAITADSWRTALRKLKDIRLLPCHHLLLTATLPPSLEGQLRKTMLMPGATVLRAETTQRLSVCYTVMQCQQYAELQAMAVRLAHTLMDEARCLPCPPLLLQEMESAAKGIIYCRSKALCNELAGTLGCPVYYSSMEASCVEVLETWRQSGGLIVSTSALGVGVDIPRVLFTLHVERPWGMIDFVQESGRMRAGGKSVIVLKQQQQQNQAIDDSEAMEAFVQTVGCRRKEMSQYMDGKPLSYPRALNGTL